MGFQGRRGCEKRGGRGLVEPRGTPNVRKHVHVFQRRRVARRRHRGSHSRGLPELGALAAGGLLSAQRRGAEKTGVRCEPGVQGGGEAGVPEGGGVAVRQRGTGEEGGQVMLVIRVGFTQTRVWVMIEILILRVVVVIGFVVDAEPDVLERDKLLVDDVLVAAHLVVGHHGAHGVHADAQRHQAGDVRDVVGWRNLDDFHAAQTLRGD